MLGARFTTDSACAASLKLLAAAAAVLCLRPLLTPAFKKTRDLCSSGACVRRSQQNAGHALLAGARLRRPPLCNPSLASSEPGARCSYCSLSHAALQLCVHDHPKRRLLGRRRPRSAHGRRFLAASALDVSSNIREREQQRDGEHSHANGYPLGRELHRRARRCAACELWGLPLDGWGLLDRSHAANPPLNRHARTRRGETAVRMASGKASGSMAKPHSEAGRLASSVRVREISHRTPLEAYFQTAEHFLREVRGRGGCAVCLLPRGHTCSHRPQASVYRAEDNEKQLYIKLFTFVRHGCARGTACTATHAAPPRSVLTPSPQPRAGDAAQAL